MDMKRASPTSQDLLQLANLSGSVAAHKRFVRSRAITHTFAGICAAGWYGALGYFQAAPAWVAGAAAFTILAFFGLFLALMPTRTSQWSRDRGLHTTQLICATTTILLISHFLDSGIRLASLFWIAAGFAFASHYYDTNGLLRRAIGLSAAIGVATLIHTIARNGIEPADVRIAWLGWVSISAFLALLAHVAGTLGSYRRRTYRSRAIAEAALVSMSEAVLILDSQRVIASANKVALDMLAYPGPSLVGAHFDEVASFEAVRQPGSTQSRDAPAGEARTPETTGDGASGAPAPAGAGAEAQPMRMRTLDGRELEVEIVRSPLRTPRGLDLGEVILLRDVGATNGLMRRLEHESRHDALTGLLNRTGLLERAIERAHEQPSGLFLIVLDLDEFKIVNDTCGHRAGDQLLLELGTMLAEGGAAGASVARLGGDEFAVLFEAPDLEAARKVSEIYLAAIEQYRFYRNHQVFRVRASAGLAEVLREGGAPDVAVEVAMGNADSACYLAKELGRNRVHVFNPGDDELARKRRDMSWAQAIRDALENERFVLMGQRISSEADRADELEVLLRLIDAEGNLVAPGAFMPAAERFNLMGDIDRHVTRRAISMLARGVDSTLCLSINLSAPSLQDPAFPTMVASILEKEAVAGTRLCFEITETVAITNLNAAGATIAALQKLGCRLALDDVGAGFSSFGYLKSLKVDRMKIDGSFVKAIGDQPVDRIMVESLHRIAREVGIETVAEMVETPELIAEVRKLGIDLMQGFGIHRPEPLSGLLGLSKPAAAGDSAFDGAALPRPPEGRQQLPGAAANVGAPVKGIPAASQQADLGLVV